VNNQVEVQAVGSGEFPTVTVNVPKTWPSIVLAPLYDVHIGNKAHDEPLFKKHLAWIAKTPNVLTWIGGDLIEHDPKRFSEQMIAAGDDQADYAIPSIKPIAHKVLFSLLGNHEARSKDAGMDIARTMAKEYGAPYYSKDYCFCTIKWRGHNFRLCAHHGSGGAQTPGGQRMAARKATAWVTDVDIFWSGHLHNDLADRMYRVAFDKDGTAYERTAMVMMSPSYLKYFGTYAAQKQYMPGTRGLAAVELLPNGEIHTKVHAAGKRL
jgi:hypothetical protein